MRARHPCVQVSRSRLRRAKRRPMGDCEPMPHELSEPKPSALIYMTASLGMLVIACSTNSGIAASLASGGAGAGGSNDGQDLGGAGTTTDDAGTDPTQDAAATPCPGTTVATCPTSVPSFSRTVTPIVKSRCTICHSPVNDAGLWTLDDLQSLSDWQFSILQDLRACVQPPPKSGVTLTIAERMAFEGWLVCGAPDN